MDRSRRNAGMTLIEIAIVMVLIGIILGISAVSLDRWEENERAGAAARSVAELLREASSDAIRTGSVHVAFLSIGGSGDVAGNDLEDRNGDWTPMLVLNDGPPGSANQNCTIDANEPILALDALDGVAWGNPNAGGTKAPGDSTAIVSTSGSSFATPAGAAATWVAFMPDGRPLAFNNACTFGALGSGNGAIYLTNGKRDYAVVLGALGSIRVFVWNEGTGAWQG